MTSRAIAKEDWVRGTVAIAVLREGRGGRQVLQWDVVGIKTVEEGTAHRDVESSDWLHISEDDARAVYEALAEHFGHAGHDTRALRKDYDAERSRVDRLIAHLTGGAR